MIFCQMLMVFFSRAEKQNSSDQMEASEARPEPE